VIRLATIDVGTNTTLLLVAEAEDARRVRVLEDRAEITRLGRGIGGDGRLGQAGIDATCAALAEYARLAHRHGAGIVAVGTEALRRAPNADAFLDRARDILGVDVEVIGGEREAALTFLAATRSFPAAAEGELVVTDIGGGSTEIIVARKGEVRERSSLPLGSVRLTERHIRHDPPDAKEIEAVLADIRKTIEVVPLSGLGTVADSSTLIGIAGTVTTLAAMALALPSYDPQQVHGYRLPLAALEIEVGRLGRSTQAERETIVGLDPKRADVIFAGACILLEVARRAGAKDVLVSDRGIRWGLLYEKL
jgi:exopolyphosphatase/guanosine-5'-triphosphate,3'-diphosphate pyrophosphatase